ncbi:MAG: T9SS type A sorting domain-containing protein [candidate division Zixibacteria bacterium]|nr:T9SS type A sorting domain-containing protein [candidate division Zixibacteria bacterium]
MEGDRWLRQFCHLCPAHHLHRCHGAGGYLPGGPWKATDGCGNSATCIQHITFTDVTAPVVTCPTDAVLQCGESTDPANTGSATATDNCGSVTISYTDAATPANCTGKAGIDRTWKATDGCGNSATCIQHITFTDVTAPVVTCPTDAVLQCGESTDPANTGLATATDDCGGSPAISYTDAATPANCTGQAGIDRTWKATDGCGNSATCVQHISFTDVTAPVVTCPTDAVLQCGESTDPANTGSATATDNCGGSVTISYSDAATPANCTGQAGIDRTWKATDDCGNSATCVQHISFTDATAPVVTCPSDKVLQCGESTDPANTGSATAVDNCGGSPAISYTDAATPANCTGKAGIDRTWKATDGCGNSATCVQHISFTDATAPVVACPPDKQLACGASTDPANTGSATATDNCGSVTISYTDAATPANCTGKAGIDRTWKAADGCGNSVTCVQHIVFVDNTAPVVTCPPDKQLQCGASTDPANTGSATAVDNCGGSVTISHTDASTPANCTGQAGVDRTWKAIDPCNNSSTCVQHITFVDNTPPSITCPPNVTVQGLENLPACNEADVVASDNCGPVSISCSRSAIGGVGCSSLPVYVTYTYTATDGCGNKASCQRIVTVILPPCIFIVSVAGPAGAVDAPMGTQISVPVRIDSVSSDVGRVDFAFAYDPAAASILSVTKGEAIAEWELFTYRLSTEGSAHVVRVTAIADQNNGARHPNANAFQPIGPVAYLNFQVSADQRFVNRDVPITLHATDCADNTMTSKAEDVTYVASGFDMGGSCVSALKGSVMPAITFSAGHIRIVEPTLQRGDINLNNVAYEVGDAVLLVDYFIHDASVFSPDPTLRSTQIAATDVNNDGVALSVADLIYLTRIITGDAMPLTPGAKLSPYAASATASVRAENGAVQVSTQSTADLGGLLLTFRYEGLSVGQPALTSAASSLRVQSEAHNGELKVLIYAWDQGARINAGANEILAIPTTGDGTIELADVQMSDASGSLLSASAAKAAVPDAYALLQNYPNPFNAGTVMPIALKNASEWSLTVYNVAGQVVRSFHGSDEAGIVPVAWDGRAQDGTVAASGMYFYRVTTPTFTATRKMTLLK